LKRDLRPGCGALAGDILGGTFVRYHVEIPLPPDEVEAALLGAPADWR
jgi:hypothetical protein